MEKLLKAAGFTDIERNPNGTFDATKDGNRYTSLYLSDVSSDTNEDAVVEEPVTFSYKDEKDGIA